MSNSDKEVENIACFDNVKLKIIELEAQNEALKERVKELENENRWLRIFGDKSKRIQQSISKET